MVTIARLFLLTFANRIRSVTGLQKHLSPWLPQCLRDIANGIYIWDKDIPHHIVSLQQHYVQNIFPLATNTQFVEQGVKEANYCYVTGQSEELSSIYSVARSLLIPEIYILCNKKRKESIMETTMTGRLPRPQPSPPWLQQSPPPWCWTFINNKVCTHFDARRSRRIFGRPLPPMLILLRGSLL
mgnify:CR=1 FL=1